MISPYRHKHDPERNSSYRQKHGPERNSPMTARLDYVTSRQQHDPAMRTWGKGGDLLHGKSRLGQLTVNR